MRNYKQIVSNVMTFVILVSTALSNLGVVNVFADDSKKIDVWDFGALQVEDTGLYRNNITIEDLDALTDIVGGKFQKEQIYYFGDVGMSPIANDRIYYGQGNKNSYGAWAKTFVDGYVSNGCFYTNGSGGETRRFVTIKANAGDKITTYIQMDSADAVLHFKYLGENGTQDDTVALSSSNYTAENFVAKYDGEYKLYTEATGKARFCRLLRTPATVVKGNIDFSSVTEEVGEYNLIFVNQTTNEETIATVNNNSYTVNLATGYEYVAKLNVAGISINNATKKVNIDISDFQSEKEANLVAENKTLYKLSGKVTGFAEGYDVSKLELIFKADETSLAEDVKTVLGEDLSFSVEVEPEVDYFVQISGVNDYQLKDESAVNITSNTEKNIDVVTRPLYNVSGNFVGLPENAEVTKVTFKNLDDEYVYSGTASKTGYSGQLRTGDYEIITVCTDKYSSYSHIVVEGKDAKKDIKFNQLDTWNLINTTNDDIAAGTYQTLTLNNVSGNMKANGNSLFASTSDNIIIPIPNDGKEYIVTAAGWYSGEINFNGGESLVIDSSMGQSTPGKLSYTAKAGETSVTLNITGEKTYLSYINIIEKVDLVKDIYVGDSSKENNYNTVTEAVKAVAAMNPQSEADRITIHIAPGVYREQVKVSTPYLTFVNTDPTQEVKITWYYGIGYQYYSIGDDGFYDPERAYDKYYKNSPAKWGGTFYLTSDAKNCYIENITFENSFNKYITEEEVIDGVEANGKESIKEIRNEYSDVVERKYTERAAAMLAEADNAEYYNCKFISSQDTLYTDKGTKQYYKNCFIEGNTDYIFGDGDIVFDGCTLNLCGYKTQASGGYITAAKDESEYGYLFRNCYITDTKSNLQTANYFGRPWGQGAKVIFLNTKLDYADIITAAGWTSMSAAVPEKANFNEYNTTYNGTAVDTGSRKGGVLTENNVNAKAYFADWTPKNFVDDSTEQPIFEVAPNVIDNGDINTPYPGHTLTVGYSFKDENHKLMDASLINWYRVDEEGAETLLKSSSAIVDGANKYKISTKDTGSYIKVVVVPETINGSKGEKAENTLQATVREGYEDPDNGSTDVPLENAINVFIAGDSTVKTYTTARGEGGWGEYLQTYFDNTSVNIVNHAEGGRSSRNFINEGKLAAIEKNIKEGDYLLIQFGHNDCANSSGYLLDRYVDIGEPDENGIYPVIAGEKTDKPDSLTNITDSTYYPYTSGTFKWYLKQYIETAKNKGATPILVTPVSRMYFTSDGTIRSHHDSTDTTTGTTVTSNDAYVTAIKQLGQEENVQVIDMFNQTKDMFEQAYKADENAANGVSEIAKSVMFPGDSTHCNKIGGFYEGGLVAKAIKDLDVTMSKYVVKPTTVGGYDNYSNLQFEVDKNSNVTIYEPTQYNSVSSYWTETAQALVDSLDGKQEPTPDVNYGDVDYNDVLTANDAAITMLYVLNDENPQLNFTQNTILRADVNGNEVIEASDAAAILQKVLDNDYTFPVLIK